MINTGHRSQKQTNMNVNNTKNAQFTYCYIDQFYTHAYIQIINNIRINDTPKSMRKGKEYYQRQSMERNLQKLLREVEYKSCGSDNDHHQEESPVNPFMKRVFEKKMRRSSVASENINPNSSIMASDLDDAEVRVRNIIGQGHHLLTALEKCTLDDLQKWQTGDSREKKYRPNKEQIVENLENMMKQVTNLLSSKQKTSATSQSTITMVESLAPPACKQKDRSIREKRPSKQIVERKTGNKSVYESVLQERRAKKSNSRII